MNKRENNTSPLKIAVLGHKTIPSRQGGIEIVVEELTVRMAKLGHKITVYNRNHKMKNVEFLGFKSGAELENVIKGARFTLIPSIWYDNLPNTALESFQYSKPVIASNIGSLPELVIDGENGYLFKPSNVEDLIKKIKMLDDDTLVKKMGQASRKRLESRFAPQTHYEDLMKIFNEAVKSRK